MNTDRKKMYSIGTVTFVLFLSTLIGVPVLPALSIELGAPDTLVPLVISASLATVVVVQFFTGVLADRYSVRILVLIGALLGGISSILCVFATDWTQLLAWRIVGGVADAIAMPALLVLTSTLAKDRPGKFFGILRGSQGLSYVVGPALGSGFSLVSLRTPFIFDGVLSLVAFVVSFILLKNTEKTHAEHDIKLFKGLKTTFADKRVYLYLLMGISGFFAYGILASIVPTKGQLTGLASWQIGLIITIGSAVFSLVSYTVGALSDKYGRKKFVIASQVIIAGSVAGLVFSDSFITLLVCYCLFTVGETTTFLLSFVYASEAFERKYMGTSMAVFDSVIDLTLFFGPLIAVSVFSITDNLTPVFIIAGIPALLAVFILGKGLNT